MEGRIVVNFSVRNRLLCLEVGVGGVSELNYSLGAFGVFIEVVSEVESAGKLFATLCCIYVLHTLNSLIHGTSGMCLHILRVGTKSDTGWACLNRVLVINRHSRLLVCHSRMESVLGLKKKLLSTAAHLHKPR